MGIIKQMIKKVFNKIAIFISLLFLFYLLLPGPSFPSDPPGSLRSSEPGDMADPNSRAYFTDLDREDVINHFKSQFDKSKIGNFPLLTIRLRDYPPEETPTRVRDQIKYSYLEELVNPLRESIFVSGFEPKTAEDAINVGGKNFKNKITVRAYWSNPFPRTLIGIGILAVFYALTRFALNLGNRR